MSSCLDLTVCESQSRSVSVLSEQITTVGPVKEHLGHYWCMAT